MAHDKEELYRSTGNHHKKIFDSCTELNEIARAVSYLHPALADDLFAISGVIENSSRAIQNNSAEMVNIDIKRMNIQNANILKALLEKASK